MASTRQIKSRIRSVRSNKQITKAMELVAASKLRKSQDAAIKSRAYADMALDILASLARTTDVVDNRLFTTRKVSARLVIIITSDRGLAGAYNSNVLRRFSDLLKDDQSKGVKTKVVAVGKKGSSFVSKLKDVEVVGVYETKDVTTQADIRSVISGAIDLFRDEEIDSLDVISTRFVNSFIQTSQSFRLLPAGHDLIESAEVDMSKQAMSFEPSTEQVLEYTVMRLIEAQLFQALLDSTASEHAMRRVAMKNASDNASEIVDALTLEMNKVRQAAITQELSEISAGVEAMK